MVVSLWYNISMRTPNAKCEICQKPLYRRPSETSKHFCCRGCRSALYKRERNYNANGLLVGRGWNKGMSKANGDNLSYGQPRSGITKQLISERLSGREFSEEHKKAISKARIALFDRIGRVAFQDRGWKFARWKKEVYKRDKYACQVCGSSGEIRAHHILSWKDYPELRFELENGITLCGDCHHKLHKGKTRNNPL